MVLQWSCKSFVAFNWSCSLISLAVMWVLQSWFYASQRRSQSTKLFFIYKRSLNVLGPKYMYLNLALKTVWSLGLTIEEVKMSRVCIYKMLFLLSHKVYYSLPLSLLSTSLFFRKLFGFSVWSFIMNWR